MTFVGRDRELQQASGWLDDAEAGRGVIALVAGEPGIGKTRFLEAVTARARERGFATVWGRAWEVSSAPPHWPWIEALRELLARPDGRTGATRLLQLLPELDGGIGEPLADPFPLYDAVAGYLRARSVREPVVVVLDDLHAADPSTLRLAELVANQSRGMRVAILGSFRDVEARLSPSVDSALARLGRRGDTIHLQRLELAAVGELVHAALGRTDLEIARMIHTASEGNPLFVRELLKLLESRGAATGDVPAGVRAVIRERLALLSPATVALLQAAAVVGRTFAIGLAAEVAGVTPAALEEAIGEAASADVVAAIDRGRYRFSHALVAETLASTLAAPVRSKLHRRAAETLERDHASDPAAPFSEIAHHWLAVGVAAAPEALTAVERAAAAAEARVAFADAAELYGSALDALANHAPGDTRRRAGYLIAQAENLVKGGERERALVACRAACEIARSIDDGVMFARAALAYGAEAIVGIVDPAMIAMLEQALPLLPAGDDAWRAQVMARLAAARQPSGDTRDHMALAHEAIAMARRLGDRSVLYEVLFRAIGALVDFERPEVRAPLDAEVARMAAEAGDRGRQLRSLQRLAFDMIDLGDLAGFERTLAEYELIASSTGQPRYRWVPMMFRAMRAHWEGRYDDDRRLSEEAWAIREQLGEPVAFAKASRRYMTDGVPPDEVDRAVTAMSGGQVLWGRMLRAWAHAKAGKFAEARADIDWLIAQPQLRDGHLAYHPTSMLAQVAWLLRDREIAAWIYPRAELERGRPQMTTSFGFLISGLFDHELMRLASLLGKHTDVETYFASSLALADRLGAAPIAQRIRDDHAAILAARGAPAPPLTTGPAGVALTQEGEFWTVRGCGELCRIKDSRGVHMLARLIAQPRQDVHALDLAGAEVVDGGDAGEVLDDDARAAYKQRLRELAEDRSEAEAWNDSGRLEKLDDEIEALTAQLSGAFGLGGRQRRTGGASERARQNVRRRIADAMQRIGESCPELGKHLARTIRTGTTCTYNPDR